MDRLITIDDALYIFDNFTGGFKSEKDLLNFRKMLEDVAIPSAEPYKGMTNGEVLQSLFPNIIAKVNELLGEQGTVFFEDTDDVIIFPLDWWNSLYKGEQE